MITRKFVGDASLTNDSFIHCVIYWLLQIWQICSFLWTRKNKKSIQHSALPPDPAPGGSAPWTPAGGSAPDPRYRLALRARHEILTLCSSKLILKKSPARCCCRVVLAALYTFVVVFVIVDVTVQTKNYYNLVSLSGVIVFLFLMFISSTAPRKARIRFASLTFIM